MSLWQDLQALINALREPLLNEPHTFAVSEIPGHENRWVGKNSDTPAAFLLQLPDEETALHPVDLPRIMAQHRVNVVIEQDGETLERTVTLLCCKESDPAYVEVFVRCIGAALVDTEGTLTAAAVSGILDRLANLFASSSQPSEKDILGLWGELLVLVLARDSESLASQWRRTSVSTFDFGSPEERLEVKATTARSRRHHLSYAQASPPQDVTAAFVSIMTERVSDGCSVLDLWRRAIEVAPGQQQHIDQKCAATLGQDWRMAGEVMFDLAEAVDTLEVYDSSEVPHLANLPSGVSQVRFVSDFDAATPWDVAAPSSTGLVAAALACRGRSAGDVVG